MTMPHATVRARPIAVGQPAAGNRRGGDGEHHDQEDRADRLIAEPHDLVRVDDEDRREQPHADHLHERDREHRPQPRRRPHGAEHASPRSPAPARPRVSGSAPPVSAGGALVSEHARRQRGGGEEQPARQVEPRPVAAERARDEQPQARPQRQARQEEHVERAHPGRPAVRSRRGRRSRPRSRARARRCRSRPPGAAARTARARAARSSGSARRSPARVPRRRRAGVRCDRPRCPRWSCTASPPPRTRRRRRRPGWRSPRAVP